MINKISAQTQQNYRMLLGTRHELNDLQTVVDNQTTTLKIMTGVLVVIAVLLAVIAWT